MAEAASGPFLLLANQGPQMVLQPDHFQEWKRGISSSLKQQEEELKDAEAYLSKLKSARQEFERLFQSEHTLALKAKLNTLELLQNELNLKLGDLNTEISRNEDSLAVIQRELVQSEADRTEHEERAQALRQWDERTKKQEQDYKDKQKAVERKKN